MKKNEKRFFQELREFCCFTRHEWSVFTGSSTYCITSYETWNKNNTSNIPLEILLNTLVKLRATLNEKEIKIGKNKERFVYSTQKLLDEVKIAKRLNLEKRQK